jgi:hypothetical protein
MTAKKEPLTRPLPDSPMYRTMRHGHQVRTGHELVAVLTSKDGDIWTVQRSCC